MDFLRITSVIFICGVLLNFPAIVTAGDIVHDDDLAPKKPGCENDFVLVYFLSEFLMFDFSSTHYVLGDYLIWVSFSFVCYCFVVVRLMKIWLLKVVFIA